MSRDFENHLLPPPYEGFFRARDLVILRADLGKDRVAIQTLSRLLELGHPTETDQIIRHHLEEQGPDIDAEKFTQTINSLRAAEIWNNAIRSNPPSGRG